ncbi:MAG: hypothetical protein JXP34_28435 [Planctomycetes bacterium]|nr:hypothetical protein [Planctomycetota bacterium]
MTIKTWSQLSLVICIVGALGCADSGAKSKSSVIGGPQSDGKQTKLVFQGPTGLICTSIEGGGARLIWTNAATYDEIQISRNDLWVATVPGDTTSYNDLVAPSEVCRYRVNGVGNDQSASSTCDLSLRPVAPIEALVCSADGMNVSLQWRNPEEYAAIEIRRNGERVAILGGVATAWAEQAPASGTTAYAVRGLDIGGAAGPSVECSLAVTRPAAPPIQDLVCGPDGAQVLISWTPPAAGSYSSIHVFRNGDALAQLGPTASFLADQVSVAGTYAYTVEGRMDGYDTAAAHCQVTVEGVPPIEAVECAVQDYDVFLTWALPEGASYTAIEVYRNGTLVATIAAVATSWSETAASAGTHQYGVRGVAAPLAASAPATCSVTIQSVPAVSDLACSIAGVEAQLSWRIPDGTSYGAIVIRRNGSQVATLDGTATAFSDALPADGNYTYEVVGRKDGVPDSEAAQCAVTLSPLAPVRDLAVDRTGTTVDLHWTLGAGYEAVSILRGDAVLADLAGNATAFQDTLPGAGLYRYAVIPRSGGRVAAPVACDVAAGRLEWLANEEPDLSGYRLYVARQSGGYGSSAEPSLELGLRTSILLQDLLEGGLIASGANYIVLTAYDSSGNVSEFSEEVAFEYHVEIGTALP